MKCKYFQDLLDISQSYLANVPSENLRSLSPALECCPPHPTTQKCPQSILGQNDENTEEMPPLLHEVAQNNEQKVLVDALAAAHVTRELRETDHNAAVSALASARDGKLVSKDDFIEHAK